MKFSILVADDDKGIAWSLKEALQNKGYQTFSAPDSASTLQAIEEHNPDLILLDLRLPGIGGMEILDKVTREHENTLVIMITAFGEVDTAVKAMKLGAVDYVTKPFNLEELYVIIEKALDKLNLQIEVDQLRKIHNKVDFVVGSNPQMQEICKTLKKVAASPATTVLIEGESGTGKELVARSVHKMSSRSSKLLMAINCTALPEHLLEAELFGYEKGAFTDARQDRKGLFELADGGSLFLDEIGDMSLPMQAKMLRALQEKRIRRVGGSHDIDIDIRIIASTNKNLKQEVQNGTFREDLYYRLQVVPIYVPPLRDRLEEIPALMDFFISHFNQEFGKNVKGVTPQAQQKLMSYSWPGNIRELRNVVERAILLESQEYIEPDHLSITADVPASAGVFAAAAGVNVVSGMQTGADGALNIEEATSSGLEGVEKYVIEQMLKNTNWNKNLTAKKLKINRTTLYNKIKKYKLEENAGSVAVED